MKNLTAVIFVLATLISSTAFANTGQEKTQREANTAAAKQSSISPKVFKAADEIIKKLGKKRTSDWEAKPKGFKAWVSGGDMTILWNGEIRLHEDGFCGGDVRQVGTWQ